MSKTKREATKMRSLFERVKFAWSNKQRRSVVLLSGVIALVGIGLPAPLLAQGTSPWENAVAVLQAAFTGPIGRGLSLVAIVVGGLLYAFGEGDKRTLAGIVFGIGMAISAVNFMAWLFP